MAEEFSKWDMADYINTAEDVEAAMNIWLEDCTAQEFAYLIGCIARSGGMTDLARKTGLNRVSLYNSLSDHGNPSLDTIMRVLDALGYRLRVEQKEPDLVGASS